MTHFAGIVLADSESEVEELLAPYDEADPTATRPKWDWWVIGGRFSGALDNYDPTSNPDNFETCKYCEGGVVTAAIVKKFPAYARSLGKTCAQCSGSTKVLKFSSDWVKHDNDVMPATAVNLSTMRWLPGVLVTPDGEWHQSADVGWFGSTSGEMEPVEWTAEFIVEWNKHKEGRMAYLVDFHV